jgi:phosphotransacetylase
MPNLKWQVKPVLDFSRLKYVETIPYKAEKRGFGHWTHAKIQGLNKPVNDLSRGCTAVDDIINIWPLATRNSSTRTIKS